MCEQIPSVTLWGTTQVSSIITTNRVYTTQIALDPIVTVDGKGVRITVTPSSASVVTNQITTRTVITSLVPQQTLYSPCPDDDGRESTATGQAQPAEPTKNGHSRPQAQGTEKGSLVGTGEFTGSLPPGRTILPASSALTLSSLSATRGGTLHNTAPTPNANSNGQSLASSATSTGVSAAATNASSDSSTSAASKDAGPIVGGVIGGVAGLILLVALMICIRRKRSRNSGHRSTGQWEEHDSSSRYPSGGVRGMGSGSEGASDDYWERRFKALEADGGRGRASEEHSLAGEKGNKGFSKSKKLHLTLDLASKALPSRPVSRMSQLSTITFFGSKKTPGQMVIPSPSHRSIMTPRKSSVESARLVKRPPYVHSNSLNSLDDTRSDRSMSYARKSDFGLPSNTAPIGAPEAVGQDGNESPTTPSISITIPTQDTSALRPSVERGAFSPTDSEVEERRNMEWIRQSHTTTRSRDSDRYAGMRKDQPQSQFQNQSGLLTASALRRISGLNDGTSQTPPMLGVLGGLSIPTGTNPRTGSGGGVTSDEDKSGFPFPIPPTRTVSTIASGTTAATRLPSLPLLASTRNSELTPGDSYSQAGADVYTERDNDDDDEAEDDTKIARGSEFRMEANDADGHNYVDNDEEIEAARSPSGRSSISYSTHPSFGMSRRQSRRDSYKTLTMYKSERGSTSSRILYPPHRTPSNGSMALSTRSKSSRHSSKSHREISKGEGLIPISPPPLPSASAILTPLSISLSSLQHGRDRVVSGPTTPVMTPRTAKSTRSMKEHRESQGKHVPDLRLSRRAITPSLWIDEELLARFADAESDAGSQAHMHADTNTARQEAIPAGEKLVPHPPQPTEANTPQIQEPQKTVSTIALKDFTSDVAAGSRRTSKANSHVSDRDSKSRQSVPKEVYDGLECPNDSAEISEVPSCRPVSASKSREEEMEAPSVSIPISPPPTGPSAQLPPSSVPSPKPSPRATQPADMPPRTGVSTVAAAVRALEGKSARITPSMPRSPASISSTSSFNSCSTMSDDVPLVLARVDRAERSAVTPHLPVLSLSSSLNEWRMKQDKEKAQAQTHPQSQSPANLQLKDGHPPVNQFGGRGKIGGNDEEERLKSVIFEKRRI